MLRSADAGARLALIVTRGAQGGYTIQRSFFLLAIALPCLVVSPTLNARKPPARGAWDFYHGLLALTGCHYRLFHPETDRLSPSRQREFASCRAPSIGNPTWPSRHNCVTYTATSPNWSGGNIAADAGVCGYGAPGGARGTCPAPAAAPSFRRENRPFPSSGAGRSVRRHQQHPTHDIQDNR